MSKKRYFTNHGYYIKDSFHDGRKWLVNNVDAQMIVDEMNNLDMKARERSKALSKLQKEYDRQQIIIRQKDNELDRLYNYFENYLEDEMSSSSFSEMWDNVKKDKRWGNEPKQLELSYIETNER